MNAFTNRVEPSRRELLKLLGGGILIAVLGPVGFSQRGGRGGGQVPQTIHAWLHIGTDGRVTVFTGKVEVGQNARTSLTQAVAEELSLPMNAIEMVMGDTDRCPYDMGTFGSRTTPTMLPQLRKAAAAARDALTNLAAEKWKIDPARVNVQNGKCVSSDKTKSITFSELAKDFPAEKEIGDPLLTLTEQWNVLGTSQKKVNGRAIVDGKHEYASDLKRPGMLYVKVLRPPSFGAKLVSVDTALSEKVDAVKVVRDGEFVAFVAPTLRAAEDALQMAEARWQESPGPNYVQLWNLLHQKPTEQQPATNAGAIQATPNGPSTVNMSAIYRANYIAHVPLEPRAALAEWDGKKLTVHTGTQRPFGVRQEVAQALGLTEAQVRVLVPDTGSGYGGKHSGEAAVEAARIAKIVGKPIKLVWTREEEFTWAYFRPGGVIDVSATLNSGNTISNWDFHNYNSGPAAIESPYVSPGARTQFHRVDSPLRQGSYRGLASTFNNFARESFIDEMANQAKMDPLAFRLQNLEPPRLKAVLREAAEAFGWRIDKPAPGRASGLACGMDKGGYVATCVEIEVSSDHKTIKVLRAATAFECGAIVNPEQLKNQVEGAVIMGIGGALFEKIIFNGGKIETNRLSSYRVPRFSDVPEMQTILVNRKDLPSAGAGECAIMAIAPAIGNAIYVATGQRLRQLPMKLS